MSLIIAVTLPLPVRIPSSIIDVEFGVFVCPEDKVCLHASLLLFSRQKNHSRPKTYRGHAILGDHGNFPLIEDHSTPWRNFILKTTNRTVPACMLHGSVHLQVCVHNTHNNVFYQTHVLQASAHPHMDYTLRAASTDLDLTANGQV